MTSRHDSPSIVICGAGFGGIGLAILLKRAGFHAITLLERAADIGGVWRDNTYPGAACDVPAALYSYSFEPRYPWSGPYPPQAEILGYLKHCVAKYGIAPHIEFNAEVARAAFDAPAGRWRIETRDGGRLEADVFVSAVGLFNKPIVPDLPGRADFRGPQFHSARWDRACPLDGKTVAVIGTGASAIQFVPTIAPNVKQLYVFQRSTQYVVPKAMAARFRNPCLERLRVYFNFERGIPRRGSERLTAKAENGWRAYLAKVVPDPELRRKLTPAYPLGCKRVLISNDWYPALQRPNVELIDAAVDAILPHGVHARDGSVREVDAIIYGTGFAPTEYLTPMAIAGLDGRELNAAWREGAEAYLGITVSGFPNFFMMYGPNTNVAGSIVYMLESQARYIVRAVRTIARKRVRLNVRADAQSRFNAELQRRLSKTVLVHHTCHSYFRTASGKVTTNWPGFMFEYRRRTSRVRLRDYEVVRA